MNRLILLSAVGILFSSLSLKAQDTIPKKPASSGLYHAGVELQGIYTSNHAVPFWLRANQFGSAPLSGASGSFIGWAGKVYDPSKTFDWGASFEGRANLGQVAQVTLIEGYIKAHAGPFELKAGRSKDIIGLTDSTLSSGSFSVSGNALGVPKISIGIPQYYSLPLLGKLFAIKMGLSNGFEGNVGVATAGKPKNYNSYYLENYIYLKVGKPTGRFDFQIGFNHEAVWGDERDVFGKSFMLSPLNTYWYVLKGKVYNGSKVGNHLGSVDLGVDYKFDGFKLSIYRQNIYDKGALWHLANLADGLNGISIANTKHNTGNFYWKKFVFEFLYTANQAGYVNSKATSSGAEDYYNNYEYLQGWTYKGVGLGSPFLTPVVYAREGLPTANNQYFINNRVSVVHGAFEIEAYRWTYTAKISYSKNYGTFANGPEVYRTVGGFEKPHINPPFMPVHQLSAYVEGMRTLKRGYSIGYDVGVDHGGLLDNSVGVIIKVSKAFL